MGDVIYGIDFRKHRDKGKDCKSARDAYLRGLGLIEYALLGGPGGIDDLILPDTAPSEMNPDDCA